jgi:hypothetical protein
LKRRTQSWRGREEARTEVERLTAQNVELVEVLYRLRWQVREPCQWLELTDHEREVLNSAVCLLTKYGRTSTPSERAKQSMYELGLRNASIDIAEAIKNKIDLEKR